MTTLAAAIPFWSMREFWMDPITAVMVGGALCAFLGVYIVLRRVIFVGAALTQLAGLGVATAFYLAGVLGKDEGAMPVYLSPVVVATLFAVGGAVFLALNTGHRRLTSESMIGLVYVAASALIPLMLASHHVHQESHDIEDVLLGKDLFVTSSQLTWLEVVALATLLMHALLYKQFTFLTFDPETARALGYHTRLWNTLLFASVGIGVSQVTKLIGALPVFAFLIVPPAAALMLVGRMRWVFALAVAIAVVGGALGYYFQWTQQLPTGATVVAVLCLFLVPGFVRLALRRA